MRYFRATPAVASAVRLAVMGALGHPNGQADQPFPESGDFSQGEHVYVALGPHHYADAFWSPLISHALSCGVQEISAGDYGAARSIAEASGSPIADAVALLPREEAR